MALDPKSLQNLQDLRVIIHSLKMNGLTNIEPGAIDEIRNRIYKLPSAEAINDLALNSVSIDDVREEIGLIIHLMEAYGKNDSEYKARYKSRTGLPPRYKVLEWRNNMKSEAKQVIKEMIKTSAIVDEKGNGKLAGDLIKLAKQIKAEEIDEKSFNQIIENLKLAGFEAEAKLLKTAALPWMQGLQGGWQGVKDVARGGFKALKEKFNVAKYKGIMDGIISNFNVVIPEVSTALAGVTSTDAKKSLTTILNQMKNMKMMANQINGEFEVAEIKIVEDTPEPKMSEPEKELVEREPTEELNRLPPVEDFSETKQSVTPTATPNAPISKAPVGIETVPQTQPQKPTYTKWNPPKPTQTIKWEREDKSVTELVVDTVDKKNGTFMAHTKGGIKGVKGPLEISKILPDNTRVTASVDAKFNLHKFACNCK